MRFRLRYLQHDLELSEGQFAVGRNASCQLSLDDPLVSRRHALLHVAPENVSIEDLQSRNGVLVNGTKIEGRLDLRPGDKILIGAQELTLFNARGDEAVQPGPSGGMPPAAAKLTLPKMIPAVRQEAARSPDSDAEPSMVRRADAFKLLGG